MIFNTDFVIGPLFRSYEIINFEFIALSIFLGAFVTAVHILVWTQSAVSNVLIAQESSNIICIIQLRVVQTFQENAFIILSH